MRFGEAMILVLPFGFGLSWHIASAIHWSGNDDDDDYYYCHFAFGEFGFKIHDNLRWETAHSKKKDESRNEQKKHQKVTYILLIG